MQQPIPNSPRASCIVSLYIVYPIWETIHKSIHPKSIYSILLDYHYQAVYWVAQSSVGLKRNVMPTFSIVLIHSLNFVQWFYVHSCASMFGKLQPIKFICQFFGSTTFFLAKEYRSVSTSWKKDVLLHIANFDILGFTPLVAKPKWGWGTVTIQLHQLRHWPLIDCENC